MKTFQLLILLIVAEMCCSLAINQFVVTNDVYYYFLIEHFSEDRSEQIVKSRNENAWMGYSLMPFFCGLKVLLISVCLFAGVFFAATQTSFSSMLGIVIKGQFVFLIPSVLKLFWFGIIQTDYSLQDVYSFPPVSLLSLFNRESMEPWQKYPLSVINLIEVLYFIALAFALSKVTGKSFGNSLGAVSKTYGLALALWVTLIVFLLVTFG